MLTLWMSMAWGHPFESQFVGHKSTMEIYPTHLELSFDLEVPLPLVERAYQESGHPDKKEWLSDWIGDQQTEIVQNLWLDVNLVRQPEWSEVEHGMPMWKEDAKFLVFSTTLRHHSNEGFRSVLLLDQVYIGEQSVYWTDVLLAREMVVVATDTIELNGTRYSTHLKRWEMEEARREVRIAMRESIWSRLDGWWQSEVLSQDSMQTMKEAFLPQDAWRLWTVGKTPLMVGIFSMFIGLVIGIKGTLKKTSLVCLLAVLSSTLPVLPASFRLAVMGVLVLGSFQSRARLLALGSCALLLCQPGWVLVPSLILGILVKKFAMVIK